jgi:hypothetical protein
MSKFTKEASNCPKVHQIATMVSRCWCELGRKSGHSSQNLLLGGSKEESGRERTQKDYSVHGHISADSDAGDRGE